MINPDNYYSVQGWMLSELGLKGNALTVYAIVYGFSQDGASEYTGSSQYLCEWTGCTKKTVLNALAELTEKGYLRKRAIMQNGVRLCSYVAVRRPQKKEEPGVKITPGAEKKLHQGGVKITPGRCKNYTGGGVEITPNNILDNYKDNIEDIYIPPEKENAENSPADPPAAPPAEPPKKRGRKKKEAPEVPKREYGKYQHVKLTDDELKKLIEKYGQNKAAQLVKYLDEYIEEKPSYKSASHYLAIRRWVVDAVNERERRNRPYGSQPRAGAAVGPNGIAIDPSKNDLDGIF